MQIKAHGALTAVLLLAISGRAWCIEPCKITVLDAANGWPVPMVELRTTHNVSFVSDNAGVIAFDLPELMGRETFFTIEGHGYGVEKDGFGNAGVVLVPKPREAMTVQVDRQLAAKRLGRLTGTGLFAESQKLGEYLEWQDAKIMGCDSVQTAMHNERLFWSWGDTAIAKYPLGLYHMIGATTARQPLQSFVPPIQLTFDYFADEHQNPRVIAPIEGEGPTWLGGFVSLPDQHGNHILVASCAKISPPLAVYELGLCIWNEQTQTFEKTVDLWHERSGLPEPELFPTGHVNIIDEDEKRWALFGDPFPSLKCEATYEAWSNPEAWQKLQPQSKVPTRDGLQIEPHRGAIAWNAYRGKWISIFCERYGKPSAFGELWYAEADMPTGPWHDAVKVVTHADYTFYNPHLHPEMIEADADFILFEATYTKTFSSATQATPRYDYNQILYRLDLDDIAQKSTE